MKTKTTARLYLATKYGHQYHIHDGGQIERLDGQYGPSSTWIMRGIRHVRRSTEFYPFEALTAELLASLTLLYKNGKPQYTVCDVDHGTHREWGNTAYHGIADLRRL
jgi:hypothetical protein